MRRFKNSKLVLKIGGLKASGKLLYLTVSLALLVLIVVNTTRFRLRSTRWGVGVGKKCKREISISSGNIERTKPSYRLLEIRKEKIPVHL